MNPEMMACLGERNTPPLCKPSVWSAGQGAARSFASDLGDAVGRAVVDPCRLSIIL